MCVPRVMDEAAVRRHDAAAHSARRCEAAESSANHAAAAAVIAIASVAAAAFAVYATAVVTDCCQDRTLQGSPQRLEASA